MLFKRKRRVQPNYEQREYSDQAYASIEEEEQKAPEATMTTLLRREVVSYCEQMLDLSQEIEDTRAEYHLVTSYLKDIQILEEMSEEERQPIAETAKKILSLNRSREEFLNADKKLSDSQYAMMEKEADQIPAAIKRLENNETYLNTINRDLHYLEGEKVEWDIVRQECTREQKLLRSMALLVSVMSVSGALVLWVLSFFVKMDMRLPIMAVLFIAALLGSYILLKYQDCSNEIKRSYTNRNHAITLENHIKIKYVNMKNAVDYTCDKYQVANSKQFHYVYEKYLEATKDQERFRQMNEELDYYEAQLSRQLQSHWLKDVSGWENYAKALVYKKDMAELKNQLLSRRTKLRYRLEYNIDAIHEMMKNVERNLGQMGDSRKQIEEILRKIEAINKNVFSPQ